MTILLATGVVAAYLIGSFPSSVVLGKAVRGIDLRNHGSGNAGASNAFRVLGRSLGVLVLLLDVGKGAAAVTLVPYPASLAAPGGAGGWSFGPTEIRLLFGAAAILGHVYSVFLRFSGGKGVGTAAGVLLIVYPLPLATAVAIFVLTLLLSGITSLASLVAAVSFPGVTALYGHLGLIDTSLAIFLFSVIAVLFLLFTHRENVRRLAKGRENRFEGARLIGRLLDRVRKRPGNRD